MDNDDVDVLTVGGIVIPPPEFGDMAPPPPPAMYCGGGSDDDDGSSYFAPPPPNLTPLQPSPRGKASTESSLALALGEMFRHVDPVQLDAIGQVATSIENAIELVCMLKEIVHGHTLLLAFV